MIACRAAVSGHAAVVVRVLTAGATAWGQAGRVGDPTPRSRGQGREATGAYSVQHHHHRQGSVHGGVWRGPGEERPIFTETSKHTA